MDEAEPPKGRVDRRSVLLGFGGLVTGAVAGAAGWSAVTDRETPTRTPTSGSSAQTVRAARVEPTGKQQAGVRRPGTPQSQALLFALDVPSTDLGWLATVGTAILDLVDGTHPLSATILPDGAGDLTVTVGLGPRLISAIDTALPGAEDLPPFANEGAILDGRRGGDVLLAAYGSDPTVLRPVLGLLAAAVPGAVPRWDQRAFRGAGKGSVVRNPLGFLDGITVPHSDKEFERNVWIPEGPLAQGSICVVRRLQLDVSAFRAQSIAEQEAVFGRRASDGRPLSGGGPLAEVDLSAKTPEGEYLIPADAHTRAANPSFTNSELMLRRGYAFDDGDGDSGLLFICFQRSLHTFVATQQRLDELDSLSKFVTPSGSATFLILPGFDRQTPLGKSAISGS